MLRDNLRQTAEYQTLAGDEGPPERTRRVDTPREAIDPVLSLEKGDVQFWLQVVQVILLYLILRELQRGGL